MDKKFLAFVAGISSILFAIILNIPNQAVTQAAGNGALTAFPLETCLNGARFEVHVNDAIALHHPLTAIVERGHVGFISNPISNTSGNTHSFTAIGEKYIFTVNYPPTTFAIGEAISPAAIANDGSGVTGGLQETVDDCFLQPTDRRLNTDWGAPAIIYFDDGIEVYVIDDVSQKGVRLLNVSENDIEAIGIPNAGEGFRHLGNIINPSSGFSIDLYRLPSGAFQMNTYYADGKPYTFRWHPDNPFGGEHIEW